MPRSPLASAKLANEEKSTASPPAPSLKSTLFPCSAIPPKYSSNLRIAMVLMIGQQTTGINVVTFFTEPLCRIMVHVSLSAQCAFVLGLAQLVFAVIASTIVDRFPRRRLVCVTGVIMAVSMVLFSLGQLVGHFNAL